MNPRAFTLHDQIARNAAVAGARTAFVCDERRVTHAQYAERCGRVAAGLAAQGVGVGDRVAVLAHNGLEFVDLLGAAARLGAILVPVNWRLSADEVAYVLRDTAPKVLVASADLQALTREAALEGMRLYGIGSDGGAWAPVQSLYVDASAPAPAALDDDAGLVIIHTAAVHGRPRGALLTHRNLLSAAAKSASAFGLSGADVHIGVLPLFHVAGVGLALVAQAAGASTILVPRFDAQLVVRLIDDAGGSLMGSFPPMLGALLDAAAAGGSKLKALRVVTGIDAPDTAARLTAQAPNAHFWVAYGQTETSGSVSLARFADRPGSAGLPVPGHAVAIVDDEDRPLPAGAEGEIVVRGPMVFHGYWNCPEDTAFTFRGGWHHTGDFGRLDADGYLWYAGRSPAKELIKPGGENVYPAEVERALLEHPAVTEAVVFGVPDAQWGEAVKAVCALAPGQALTAEALIEFVGRRIARYKKPKHVVFVSALPKTAAGAVDRAAVKAMHASA